MERMAERTCGEKGYNVPALCVIAMSPYVMHHDARYFPDPLRFDPDRFTHEARESRPQFSYFPFGGGPRRCIGEGFSWLEGTFCLAALAQRWRLTLDPHQQVMPQALITLRPKNGIRMTTVARPS